MDQQTGRSLWGHWKGSLRGYEGVRPKACEGRMTWAWRDLFPLSLKKGLGTGEHP
jgi:hypothetical protein